MAQVEALEDQANQIKKALSEAKKDLAKAMRN
jgi:NACalpha-BTF3-like transcription factor